MFWGLILEPYKRYTQCVERSFHVSMACLDVSQSHEYGESVQVMVNYKNRSFLLCTLNNDSVFQTPLDVIFEKGDNITFYCNGRGFVHMTGYLLPNDIIDSDSEDSNSEIEEEQGEGEEIELNTIPEKSLKRKAESQKSKKKTKLIKQESFESNNWDDDDDDDDEKEENNSSLENDSDNDIDIEDEEDESDDDEEEEEQEHEHEEVVKPQKHEKKEIENQQQNKQKKKHDKQNKINGEEVKQEIKQEQQSKKQKKKAEQQTQKNNLIEAKKRTIEGGVQVEDIKPGNGALATSGKLVTVYYVGRCKIGKEEKKVDSCTQGNGFKFRLGKGQVIKGWDVGISGMKVGGKRRLTIPPNMGYGAKGSLPTIPGNSTLVFEIELKNVN